MAVLDAIRSCFGSSSGAGELEKHDSLGGLGGTIDTSSGISQRAKSLVRVLNRSRGDVLEDRRTRAHALGIAKELVAALEEPQERAMEVAYWPAFAMCVRVALDLHIFETLSRSAAPKTARQLADMATADEVLIVRLMRPLSALGFVREIDPRTYMATPMTHAMTVPAIHAGHRHFFDHGAPALLQTPSLFRKTGFRTPSNPRACAFQQANPAASGTDALQFWLHQPEILRNFTTFMCGTRGARSPWWEWFPVRERLLSSFDDRIRHDDQDPVLLVDIAGTPGHDLQGFLRYVGERVRGRLVLEDLPKVIASIPAGDLEHRIEKLGCNFFEEQPIKGARAYFLHFVLHDWPDPSARKILHQIARAMRPGYSKLLINEYILPDEGVPLFPTGLDLELMALHAGMERTRGQWMQLLGSVGLEVVQFWDSEDGAEGIIEAMLKVD